MTGQVKEEILTRFGELGCFVENGCIKFDTSLLLKEEFLLNKKTFTYFDISKIKNSLQIHQNQLAYTYCQVPILYTLTNNESCINLTFKDYSKKKINGNLIDKKNSHSIFDRTGKIKQIELQINEKFLFNHNT